MMRLQNLKMIDEFIFLRFPPTKREEGENEYLCASPTPTSLLFSLFFKAN
jgi:hypothetical protein